MQDMDDCLTMIFLFASLPTEKRIHQNDVKVCTRFVKEWQAYIVHTKALRKVFVSLFLNLFIYYLFILFIYLFIIVFF
jgi:pescadillo protein